VSRRSHKYQVTVPRYDIDSEVWAYSPAQAVLVAAKRAEAERPYLQGRINYSLLTGNAVEYVRETATLDPALVDIQHQARACGVRYVGPQDDKDGALLFYWIQDPISGTSFAVKPGRSVAMALRAARERMKPKATQITMF